VIEGEGLGGFARRSNSQRYSRQVVPPASANFLGRVPVRPCGRLSACGRAGGCRRRRARVLRLLRSSLAGTSTRWPPGMIT